MVLDQFSFQDVATNVFKQEKMRLPNGLLIQKLQNSAHFWSREILHYSRQSISVILARRLFAVNSVALPILLKILFKFEAILYITILVSEVLRSCIKPWSSPWIVCSQKHIGSAMHATRSSWPRNERYISYRNGFSTRFSIHDSPCSEWKDPGNL